MIKFFRHIRKSLLMENKTSKYFKYAIGEIILVVIGILIALQINNWNENRKNTIREIQFLKNFKADLLTNKLELERVIKKTERTIIYADSILQHKKGALESLSLFSFTNCIMNASGFTVYKSQEGTIQDILGSGNLDVISNDSIRFAIGSWTANLKNIREWESLDKNTYSNYSNYLHRHINLYEIDERRVLPVNNGIMEELMRDRVFLNGIRDRVRNPKILNSLYKKEITRLDGLISQINEELSL